MTRNTWTLAPILRPAALPCGSKRAPRPVYSGSAASSPTCAGPEPRRAILEQGFFARPSQYSSEPYVITRALIEEGRAHLLLGDMIETGCPVRILQGVKDPDVPWDHAVELVSHLAQDDVVLTLVKDGDHRLSRPEDIERLIAVVEEF